MRTLLAVWDECRHELEIRRPTGQLFRVRADQVTAGGHVVFAVQTSGNEVWVLTGPEARDSRAFASGTPIRKSIGAPARFEAVVLGPGDVVSALSNRARPVPLSTRLVSVEIMRAARPISSNIRRRLLIENDQVQTQMPRALPTWTWFRITCNCQIRDEGACPATHDVMVLRCLPSKPWLN